MGKSTEYISRAEAARRLGVSASMVSKYCKRGLPSRADGRLEWSVAESWTKAHIVPSKSGNYYSRRRKKNMETRELEDEEQERAIRHQTLNDISSKAEVLRFARVARRLGVAPEAAFMLTVWYVCQAAVALGDFDEELADPGEPTDAEWASVLGKELDLKALREGPFKAATDPEVLPGLRDKKRNAPAETKIGKRRKE